MSAVNGQTQILETEIVNPDMINEAIESCFVSLEETNDRALEFVTSEDVGGIADEPDFIESESQEIETAEEVSLKNGVYHEIRRKLSERFNIPHNEIAFIHDADTPQKKETLFKDVNAGRVRVLIGSTSKLGTGVNVQKRLVALHHLDEPWKPAELEQREGRILRQGNIYPEAFIFHYVTERSFDGYMLQTLESKARFISQIMAGEVTARTAEDVGDMVLTVAQVKAIASGNPLVQRRIELEVKLVKLDRLRAAYFNNRALMRADLEELPERITSHEYEIAGHERAIKSLQPLKEDAFCMILKKKLGESEIVIFDKRERAGAQIRYFTDLLTDRLRVIMGRGSLTEEVGTYRGFKVYVHVSGNARLAAIATLFNFQYEIHLRGEEGGTCYVVAQIGESNVGITQSIDYQLRHVEDRLEQSLSNLEMLRSRLSTVQVEVDKPWAHTTEYSRLRREYEAIGTSLESEGIEIENNTTFTVVDDCEENEITNEMYVGSDQVQISTETDVDEEFGSRSNPFTGLEDWAIITQEPISNEDDFLDSGIETINSSTLTFDFIAASQNTNDEEEDIFLAPPSCDTEEDNSETIRNNTSLYAKAEPKNRNGKNKKQTSSNKKPSRSAMSTNQASLWG